MPIQKMLLNIRKVRSEDALRVKCNSGIKIVDRVSNLPGYGNVWYKPTGITKIISMSRAMKKFWVVFDSESGNFFRMVLPDREAIFQRIPTGLYYFDDADRENIVLLLSMVLDNQEGFTRREYEGAQEARRAMHLMGFLSEREFENMLCLNMIVNCLVTFSDVKKSKLIFGPDITSLKGKSVRRKTASVIIDYV